MKLVIDIPEERLNSIKQFGIKQNEVYMLEKALISGTPLEKVLEDIKAEIEKHRNSVNAGNDDFRIGVLWGIDDVTEIIDRYTSGKENE